MISSQRASFSFFQILSFSVSTTSLFFYLVSSICLTFSLERKSRHFSSSPTILSLFFRLMLTTYSLNSRTLTSFVLEVSHVVLATFLFVQTIEVCFCFMFMILHFPSTYFIFWVFPRVSYFLIFSLSYYS